MAGETTMYGVSCQITDRLRGKYAVGPHLPNGNPEFGWRQFEAPPIQHEAADLIEMLEQRIGYALDLMREGLIDESFGELDRALNDPDLRNTV